MKIVTLNSNQHRIWKHNAPVLVYTDTNESVLVNGNPRTATKDEIKGILTAIKLKKQFSVDVGGKPAHFVNGREFLKRVFVRAHQGREVQLRSPNGTILGMSRKKFSGHDIANSEVPATDKRPHRLAKVDSSLIKQSPSPLVIAPQDIPSPEDCPECSHYAKPLGCRQDEHHFVCKYHDKWEQIREAKLQDIQVSPVSIDEDKICIFDLTTGTPLREASSDEIETAREMQERNEIPILTIGDSQYGIGNSQMIMP